MKNLLVFTTPRIEHRYGSTHIETNVMTWVAHDEFPTNGISVLDKSLGWGKLSGHFVGGLTYREFLSTTWEGKPEMIAHSPFYSEQNHIDLERARGMVKTLNAIQRTHDRRVNSSFGLGNVPGLEAMAAALDINHMVQPVSDTYSLYSEVPWRKLPLGDVFETWMNLRKQVLGQEEAAA